MTNEELNTALYKKMFAEQQRYREWLLSQPPDEIYGHHMKNETMFHDLCNYASKDFYDEHPVIKFDTLFGFGEYQIVAVFRFDTNNDTFRYNQFTDMDEEHFKNFMNSVHLRQFYDTGVDAEYGDHLITLSTCECGYALASG